MDNTTSATGDGGDGGDGEVLIRYFMPPDWSLNAELVIMVIVFVLGIPGNALIVTVQFKNKNKTSTDWLVMVMAMYEFLGSSVNTIMKALRDIVPLYHLISSSFYCKFTPFAYFFGQFGSAETLMVLAVDRAIKTMFPLSTWYGVIQVKVICLIIFIWTALLTTPQLVLQGWDPISLQCALYYTDLKWSKRFGIAGSIMMEVIFCILSLSYLSIVVSLKRRHVRKVRQRKKAQQKQAIAADSAPKPVGDSMTNDTTITSCPPSSSTEVSQVVLEEKDMTKSEDKPDNTVSNVAKQKSKMLTLEGRNVNKLTGLMFFISLFYIASYSILWYLYVTSPIALGAGVLQLAYAIPMLNCISNPVMFFTMSTRFRSNVKQLFKRE